MTMINLFKLVEVFLRSRFVAVEGMLPSVIGVPRYVYFSEIF